MKAHGVEPVNIRAGYASQSLVENMNKSERLEKQSEREEAIKRLREILKPSDTIYTVLKHVSSSGMNRRIDCFKFDIVNGKIVKYWLSYSIAKALGWRLKDDAVVVGGCGMDMGFHLVYSLARTIFNNDYACTGENCQSNDHTNDRDGSWSRDTNKGRQHSDAGYSLNQEWL